MSSYAWCLVIHLATCIWFWTFLLALNKLEQHLQQYFKKWGNGTKIWMGWSLVSQRGWYPSSLYGRHLKIDSNQSIELWSDLSLRLMVKRFQRSSQVQFLSCWFFFRALLDLLIYRPDSWRSALRHYIQNQMDLVQTPLGTKLSLGTQLCYQASSDLVVKKVSNAVINIELVMLPLDSGPKLAVGQWKNLVNRFAWGTSSSGELCMLSYQSCHIYGTWRNI